MGPELAAGAVIPELGLIAEGATALGALEGGIGAEMLGANFLPAAEGGFSLSQFLPSLGAAAWQVGSAALREMNDQTNRKTALNSAMRDYGVEKARDQRKSTEGYIDTLAPAAREAELKAAQESNAMGYDRTIASNAASTAAPNISGKLSPAYTEAQGKSADEVAKRTAKMIEALSTMRAPAVAGSKQAIRFGRAASDVSNAGTARENVNNAYRTDMASVAENPWLNMGADVASGIGHGIMVKDAMKKLKGEGVFA